MSAYRPVRRDVAQYALATLVPAALGFAGVVLLVQLLGEAVYGRLSVVLGAALLAAAFAVGWLAQALLRFHAGARAEGESHALAATTTSLALRALVLVLPLLMVWLLLTPDLPAGSRVAGVLLCAAAALYQVRTALAQADFRPRDVLWGELVRAAGIPLAAGVAAYWFDGSVAAVLAVMAAAYVGGWLLLGGRVQGWRVERTLTGRIWAYGWPLGVWLAASQLLVFADRYIVALHHGYGAAGRYAAGFELVRRGLVLVLSPITLAVHPALVERWSAHDRAGAHRLWRRALLAQLATGAAVVALYVPLAGQVQTVAFGFALSWPVNLAMAVSGATWAVALIAHKPLELELRTRTMVGALLAAAALNVGANLVLVPRFGAAAAAHVSAVSAAAYLLLVLALRARSPQPSAPLVGAATGA